MTLNGALEQCMLLKSKSIVDTDLLASEMGEICEWGESLETVSTKRACLHALCFW